MRNKIKAEELIQSILKHLDELEKTREIESKEVVRALGSLTASSMRVSNAVELEGESFRLILTKKTLLH